VVMETGSVAVPMMPGLGAELDDRALSHWDVTRVATSP
jgi:hypothetical protein